MLLCRLAHRITKPHTAQPWRSPFPPGLFEASRLLPSLGLLGCTPSREACRALAGAAGAELQAWGWRAAVQQQGAANVLPPERALRALLQVRRTASSTDTTGLVAVPYC